jgi:hypothetical protein
MSLSYTYIIVSGSFLFSGFNHILHFMSPTTVYKCYLNKVLRVQQFHFRVPLPLGGPSDRQKGGWPWQPLMSFDGRVAESSRVPHNNHGDYLMVIDFEIKFNFLN